MLRFSPGVKLNQVRSLAFLLGTLPCILGSAQDAVDLIELEQEAFRSATGQVEQQVVQIETFGGLERIDDQTVADGPTTGTLLSADGWIISSLYSFRQKPASILVTLPNGNRLPASIVARDYSRELALLKIDVDENQLGGFVTADYSAAPNSELVGSWVVALGKTYSKERASQSIGIVSAVGRAFGRAIQTDAKISPINYGGPLIDLQGRILGILAPISPGTFFEGDSAQLYDSGIGFAIPISDILARLPRLQQGQDIFPGKLGIVTNEQNELAGPVMVVGSMPGSPAGKAQLRKGDIVLAGNGTPIRILADLKHALASTDAGQVLTLSLLRGKQEIEVECELARSIPVYRRRYLGLWLRTDQDGLRIVQVDDGSPAAESGILAGQRLVQFNNQPATLEDLRESLAVAELDQEILLSMEQDGADAASVRILPAEIPNDLPRGLPTPSFQVEEPNRSEIVDVALGDFPNQAFAIIPPNAENRPLGLVMVFPEPGELDRERSKQHWEKFAAEYGWIVTIVQSANPKRWSMDELELAGRVLGRMQKAYDIDSARTVISGLGVSGKLAFVAGNMLRGRVRGVLLVGTKMSALAREPRNSPLQSLDYFFVGVPSDYDGALQTLRKAGFSASSLQTQGLVPQKWETHPASEIFGWLEGLSRL